MLKRSREFILYCFAFIIRRVILKDFVVMNFRYDINGLRAIAVIAVVLFHFNPAWVPGGFAGVDVFFVISGFLMTGIIFRGLENKNFNLFKFYVARANRIIPALAALCLVLLVFGWFYLVPMDFKSLGKHVIASISFLSNFTYWNEVGYFDTESHRKWLLHTWSLSVEWQFYILYPIVLVVLKRFLSLENLKRLIVVGTILGFGFSVVATMKWPTSAYYLLPTRAWELMMGGVAFLYPWNISENKKKLIETVGLILILASYAFVSNDVAWPGYFASLPVIGAYFMIVANRQSSLITNNVVFQSLGKWSYSIYLWHWPIVAFGYNFEFSGWLFYAVALPLSVFAGVISFFAFERQKNLVYWSVLPLFAALFVYINNGYAYQMDKDIFNIINIDYRSKEFGGHTWLKANEIRNKPFNTNSNKKKIILIGDSMSADFTNILVRTGIESDFDLSHFVVSAKCAVPYFSKDDMDEWIEVSKDIKPAMAKKDLCMLQWKIIGENKEIFDADIIILAMNWRGYSKAILPSSLTKIKEMNNKAKLVVVGRKSIGIDIPKYIYEHRRDETDVIEKSVFTKVQKSLKAMDEMENYIHDYDKTIEFVNFKDIICDVESQKCDIMHDGHPLLYDRAHSTQQGNKKMAIEVSKLDIFR